MAQFSEFATTIPHMEIGLKQQQQIQQHLQLQQQQQQQLQFQPFQQQSSPQISQQQPSQEFANVVVTKTPKLPKQAGGIDRLLDSIGFYGLDRLTFKLLRNAYPSEQRKDETCEQLHYRCSACNYQAMSLDHVFVHQALAHYERFYETLKQRATALGLRNQRYEELLEVFDYLSERDNKPSSEQPELCKIIRVSNGADFKQDSLNEFFFKFGIHGSVPSGSVRCAFCSTSETEPNNFWSHLVTVHPTYPFLAFISSRDSQQQTSERRPEVIFREFFERIENSLGKSPKKATLKRKHDEIGQESVVIKTGAKKFGLFDDEQFDDELTDEAEDTKDEEPQNGAVVDVDNQQVHHDGDAHDNDDEPKTEAVELDDDDDDTKCADSEPELGPSTPKRARFDVVKKVARRSASLLGTAALAVGVYHLTYYLPQSIQSYLQ